MFIRGACTRSLRLSIPRGKAASKESARTGTPQELAVKPLARGVPGMVWCPSDLRPKSLSVWLCLALTKNLTSFCYKRGVRGGSPDTAVAGSLIGETGPGSATLIMSFARTSVRRLSLLNQLYVLVIASHPGFFCPCFSRYLSTTIFRLGVVS